ncbi:hypothetical protein ACFXGA_06345 [Actinosynnema sp. NPDC059335]|uniref:hypothetical protein n=1 Tax=Actinosynnema sp. NPDC059335 TaxID=3346804 RepID=UPI00366DD701
MSTGDLVDLAGLREARRVRQLELENTALRAQLAAVIDTVANETALAASLAADEPLTEQQLAGEAERARRHLMRVALRATHRTTKPTGGTP